MLNDPRYVFDEKYRNVYEIPNDTIITKTIYCDCVDELKHAIIHAGTKMNDTIKDYVRKASRVSFIDITNTYDKHILELAKNPNYFYIFEPFIESNDDEIIVIVGDDKKTIKHEYMDILI